MWIVFICLHPTVNKVLERDNKDFKIYCIALYRIVGPSSVVRVSEFKSQDPGFDPSVGLGEGHFFLSLRVNSCADLFTVPPELPSCVQHTPTFVRMLKIPYPSVIKKRPHSRWYGNTKTLHTGGKSKQSWATPYYGCLLSLGKAARILCVQCTGTRKLSDLI